MLVEYSRVSPDANMSKGGSGGTGEFRWLPEEEPAVAVS